MKDLNGLVEYENIENVARTNFSGRDLPTKDYKETANKVKEFSKKQADTIIEKNYNWLYENRNIENNIYELKNLDKAEKEISSVKSNNLITLLFEEIGNMQRKYNKDVKEAWDIKESTEEFYINREKWDQNQLKEKDKEIENLKNKVSVLLLQLKVPDNVIKDCKKILDYKGTSLKGYYFVKSNGEITGIKGIHVDNGINQIICDDDAKNLYRITSSHIHSSFLSVLQFGQMFNDNINSYVKTIIKSTYILLATILYDFCCYSNDAHIILNQIDKDAFEILSYILKENKHDYINCIRK